MEYRLPPGATPETCEPLLQSERWLDRAVIGLNLCPFAKSVRVHRQVRWVVSEETDLNTIADLIEAELRFLAEIPMETIETSLLVFPNAFADFLAFNEFLGVPDRLLMALDLEGILQVASFHPHYQFAGEPEGDISHYTNRSPYPILHLIREASIERAAQSYPDPMVIVERNIATLNRLGLEGWRRLFLDEPHVP